MKRIVLFLATNILNINRPYLATPITHLTISDAADAEEGTPPVDGYFTISRDGDFSGDLPVRFLITGTQTNTTHTA